MPGIKCMTWRELRDQVNKIGPMEIDDHVAIFDHESGECRMAIDFGKIEEMDQQGDVSGVLDDGHYVIKT